LQRSNFAYSYTFLHSVVCHLLPVCHIRVPIGNRSTALDATSQIQLEIWGKAQRESARRPKSD